MAAGQLPRMDPAATGQPDQATADPLKGGHHDRPKPHEDAGPAELHIPEQQQGSLGAQVGGGEGQAWIQSECRG